MSSISAIMLAHLEATKRNNQSKNETNDTNTKDTKSETKAS